MTDERLKEFMLDNFDFDSLKEAGFWPKGTKRNDYEAQAARVCQWFGYQSVYEYAPPRITGVTEATLTGHSPDKVDKDGYKPGGGFLICGTTSTEFICPCCTKQQDANDYKAFRKTPEYAQVKCNGCKRHLVLAIDIFDGKFTVIERNADPS